MKFIKIFSLNILICILMTNSLGFAVDEPDVVYWDTPKGKSLHSRIPADADYWQLSSTFAMQSTQTYCAVASAITVLNAMPINKPVDPIYAPFAYFTQTNFFTPDVSKVISAETVLNIGMTRDEMVKSLNALGVHVTSVSGDSIGQLTLRKLLKKALGDDGNFVLVNYLRTPLGQIGGGHWSVLAAYDAISDRVLVLDVAKYKYPPAWIKTSLLLKAINTIDSTSNQYRGLVLVSQ